MRSLATLVAISRKAGKGVKPRDKWIGFLLLVLVVTGTNRRRLRHLVTKCLDRLANDHLLLVRVSIKGRETSVFLRRQNEGDYLMAGEFFAGSYAAPDFTPETVVDGGANIGLFALWAAAHFPAARLICYEPDADNVEMLGMNLVRNAVEAQVHMAALRYARTTAYYHASHSHIGYVDDVPPGIEVPCTMPDVTDDCWLKLDIEGAEYEVLPALFDEQRYPRYLSMEVHHFKSKGQSILRLLREHEYTVEGGDDDDATCCTIAARRLQG